VVGGVASKLTQVLAAERWLGLTVGKQTESSVETCTQKKFPRVGRFLYFGGTNMVSPTTSSVIFCPNVWLHIWIGQHLALDLTQAQRLSKFVQVSAGF
jgi:hypothetical protein